MRTHTMYYDAKTRPSGQVIPCLQQRTTKRIGDIGQHQGKHHCHALTLPTTKHASLADAALAEVAVPSL